MTSYYKALCAELVELDQAEPGDYSEWKQRWIAAIKRARTALAVSEPEGLSDEDALAYWYEVCEGKGKMGS